MTPFTFLEGLGNKIFVAIIVAIVIAILTFIYKKKIILKIKSLIFWLFDMEISVDSFVGYLAMEEMLPEKFISLLNEFKISMQKDGFAYKEFSERDPLCLKSIFVEKNNLPFKLDVIDIPAESKAGNYYKIKITLLTKKLNYRTTTENLKNTITNIIKITDRAIGNLSSKPNYVSTIPNPKPHRLNLSHHDDLTIIYSKKSIQIKDIDIAIALDYTKRLSLR